MSTSEQPTPSPTSKPGPGRSVWRRVGWRFWVGLAVTGAALYLAMRHVEWDRFAASMRLIDVWWVAGGVLLFLSSLVVRAVRWRLLLRQVIDPQSARLRTKDVFSYLLIGYAANNVLPMRMGEIARAYYVAQKEQTSTGGVLATIAVERVFDLLGLVFFVVLLTLTMEMPTEIRVSMIAVEGLAVVALSVLIALSFVDPKLGRLRTILSKVLPQKAAGRVMRLLETFVIGLRTARSKKVLISVGLLSMSIWLLIFGDAFFYTRAFHMGLPFLAAIFVVTVANLGTMIPSSPGGLGVAHYLFVVALGVWHIAREPALGFAVVRHGVSYLLTTSIGLACLWVTSLSFRSLVESTPKASEAAGEAAAVVEGETTAAGTKNAEKTEGVCRVRARPTGAGAEMRDQR